MKNSTILKRAKKLIEKPEKWTRFVLRDPTGRHCMLGAVDGFSLEADAIPFGIDYCDVIAFNDDMTTTHDEVMMAFDFAILFAQDEEAAEPRASRKKARK